MASVFARSFVTDGQTVPLETFRPYSPMVGPSDAPRDRTLNAQPGMVRRDRSNCDALSESVLHYCVEC